jgi:hypothetical protein
MRTDRELTALFAGAIVEERPDPTFLDELFELLVDEVATVGPAAARRPHPRSRWSRASRWPLLIAAGIVVALLAFGVLRLQAPNVGPPTSPTPTPSATPVPPSAPPLPTQPVVPSSTLVPFTATRYGYSITYPTNWGIRPATATLDATIYPIDTDPTVDNFSASVPAAGDPGLLVAGPAVPVGTTLAAWMTQIQQLQASGGFNCPPPQATEAVQIGGEPGQLLTWVACPEYLLWAGAIHGDHAYHVILIDKYAVNNPAIQAADKALFLRILASLTFTNPAPGSPRPS